MLRNYLTIAIRTLRKNRVFSFVNIIGLSAGIACALILYLFISNELGFDAYHSKADRTYRIYVHTNIDGKETNMAKSCFPAGEMLLHHFPEVESFVRVGYNNSYTMRYGGKSFREYRVYTADSNYFNVFTQKMLVGNAATALSKPNHVVLTKSTAEKYFGKEDPLGKTLLANEKDNFIVAGVMEDFPAKSHFNCDILLSMATNPPATQPEWLSLGYSTFVVLKKGTDPGMLEEKIKPLVDENAGPQIEKILGTSMKQFLAKGNAFELKLQPLTSIYLYSKSDYHIDPNTEWGHSRTSDIEYIRIFIGVALFVLLIAVFNFMNLSTARSGKRAKEVGVRKTLGSARWQLIVQFMTEAVLTTAIAVIIALLLVQLSLPWFNQLSGKALTLSVFAHPGPGAAMLLFTVLVGGLAGSYPALFLSSFQPIETLKGAVKKRKTSLRSILVVSQFAISIALIIGMIAIRYQLFYMQHKNLGFTKENMITVFNGAALGNKVQVFKQELLKNPQITAVTNSSLIFASGVPEAGYVFESSLKTNPVISHFLDVDNDFIKTFEVKLKEGRFFDPTMTTDSNAVVINETAAKELAFSTVIGKTLTKYQDTASKTYQIVGVVKDFNYESLYQTVKPLVFHLSQVTQPASYITLRVKADDPVKMGAYLETVWNKMGAVEKCNYGFLDDTLENLYSAEKKISTIATLFTILAIFIACLGLFGLALFVTEQRTKEIGIRKILGANVREVVITLSKKFVAWIVLANLVAWPVAYFVLNKWLQHFAYHIDPGIWIFVLSGVITLIIAMATIGFHSIKAARANPVKSLRTE